LERSNRPELRISRRAGDFIFVAGMRGIDSNTDTPVSGDEARIRQAFLNMRLIAESEGASLGDAVRLVVFVTDMQSPDPPLRIYVLLFRLCIAHEWSSLFPVFLRQRPTFLFWLLRLPCPAPF
jgi:enamine deaminase RidA (YjgF/YER057c/UK114 family)